MSQHRGKPTCPLRCLTSGAFSQRRGRQNYRNYSVWMARMNDDILVKAFYFNIMVSSLEFTHPPCMCGFASVSSHSSNTLCQLETLDCL